MIILYITIGSVTTAVRLKRLLENDMHTRVQVVRTPPQLNRGGCSYSVIADDALRDSIRSFCAGYDIAIKGIYIREGDEYYAVSG